MNLDWLKEGTERVPYNHQLEAVEFFDPLDDGNLFFEMGCVAGDTEIFVNRSGASKRMTIAEAYNKATTWRNKFGEIPTIKTRSFLGDRIGLNNIVDIKYSGLKNVIKVTLKERSITLTPDHEVMTDVGFIEAGKLSIGSKVMVDSNPKAVKVGTISFSEVINIETIPEPIDTYDIICEDPHRNFVANGIVVHNCGKTGTAILTYRNWNRKENRMMRCLVLCPSVVIHNWKDEFRMFSHIPPSKVHTLIGTGKAKAAYMYNKVLPQIDGAVCIVNYEAMLNEELFKAIERWNPEVIIYDEVHMLKNSKSKRSKLCIRLSEQSIKRLGLTGTPILKNSKDMYGIFRAVDCGKTFGINEYVFQSKYLIDKFAHVPSVGFPSWIDNPKSYKELQEKIYRKSLRKLKEECLDLPELIKDKRMVELSPVQRKAYNDLKRDFLTYVSSMKQSGQPNAVTAQVAVTKAIRMLQIAAGYVQTDEEGIHEFSDNPRLDVTEELLVEIVKEGGNKCILWCSYKYNYVQLSRLCDKLGIKYVMITGEQNTNQKRESELAFQNDPSVEVVICNRRAGGIGVNLTAAKYSIVYSRNFSLDEELQSEARNHRGGSQIHDKILKIDLVAIDTIEVDQLNSLRNKKQISMEILDIIK